MLNTNFNVQGTNVNMDNSMNVLQNRHSRQGATVLNMGQRRFGTNMSTTSVAFKARLLQMRQISDDVLTSINNLRDSAFSVFETSEDEKSQLVDLPDIAPTSPEYFIGRFIMRTEGELCMTDLVVGNTASVLGKNNWGFMVGDRMLNFTYNVTETDTIGDIPQLIADGFNNSNYGSEFFATVVEIDGHFTLKFTVKSSGSNGGPDQNITSPDGEDIVETDSDENANYQSSNDIGLVSQIQNGLAQIEVMRNFIDTLNAMLNAGDGQGLTEKLVRLLEMHENDLSLIGIYANELGFLHVDEARVTHATESGAVDHFIISGGFLNQLEKIIEGINLNPPGLLFEALI